MKVRSSSTEVFLLRFNKFIIVSALVLTLIVAFGAALFGAYLYFQTPGKPEAVQEFSKTSINPQEYIKNYLPVADEDAKEAPEPAKKTEPIDQNIKKKELDAKYDKSLNKLMGCAQTANPPVDVNAVHLRGELIRIAEEDSDSLGDAYMADSADFVCSVFNDEEIVKFRTETNDKSSFFIAVLNDHLNAWREMKEDEAIFEMEELQRVRYEALEEEARVEEAKAISLQLFMFAAGALGFFLIFALYLVISAIESNLRNISVSLQNTQSPKE